MLIKQCTEQVFNNNEHFGCGFVHADIDHHCFAARPVMPEVEILQWQWRAEKLVMLIDMVVQHKNVAGLVSQFEMLALKVLLLVTGLGCSHSLDVVVEQEVAVGEYHDEQHFDS